jgi:hypothetical protein
MIVWSLFNSTNYQVVRLLPILQFNFICFFLISYSKFQPEMGNDQSIHVMKEDNHEEFPLYKNQMKLQSKISIPLQIQGNFRIFAN